LQQRELTLSLTSLRGEGREEEKKNTGEGERRREERKKTKRR